MATKIGILGLGKMGEALVKGLQQSPEASQYKIQATTRSSESASEAGKRLKITCHTDNSKLIEDSDVVILCVKPHQAKDALRKDSKSFKASQLLISVAASLTTDRISDWSGGKASIIRAMPNTPCLIGEGMTALCAGPRAKASHLKQVEEIFGTVGRTLAVEEALMDGVTGLSGCGPAYVYLILEALSEAGVKVGLSRKNATLLAAQTLAGSAKMVLERGEHPAALKDEVTTPAGCTIDGLMALEDGKLRVTLIKAVVAATKRSRKLAE
jgi:pyrroline-5-carboxylate reductase